MNKSFFFWRARFLVSDSLCFVSTWGCVAGGCVCYFSTRWKPELLFQPASASDFLKPCFHHRYIFCFVQPPLPNTRIYPDLAISLLFSSILFLNKPQVSFKLRQPPSSCLHIYGFIMLSILLELNVVSQKDH